jgi:predicted ribosome quality control (RQC) complex YloA/Tae2 family protein
MAVADDTDTVEQVLEDARDTLSRNEAAKKDAEEFVEELLKSADDAEEALNDVDRRLRQAGLHRAAAT